MNQKQINEAAEIYQGWFRDEFELTGRQLTVLIQVTTIEQLETIYADLELSGGQFSALEAALMGY